MVVASLDAERASHKDVEQWVIDGSLWGWVSEDESSPDETAARLERYRWLKEVFDEEAQRIADEVKHRIETEGEDRAIEWFNARAWAAEDGD
jgi:hypothetical protein